MSITLIAFVTWSAYVIYKYIDKKYSTNIFTKEWVNKNDHKQPIDKLIALLDLESSFLITSVLSYYEYKKVKYYRGKAFPETEYKDIFLYGFEYNKETKKAVSFIRFCEDLNTITMDFTFQNSPTYFGHPNADNLKNVLKRYRTNQPAELIQNRVISYYNYKNHFIILEVPNDDKDSGLLTIYQRDRSNSEIPLIKTSITQLN